MMNKLDLNDIDQLQKTIKDLKILKENCPKEDIQHWENLIWYYTALQKGEIDQNQPYILYYNQTDFNSSL